MIVDDDLLKALNSIPDFNSNGTMISYDIFFPKVIIPEVRIFLVKNEILNNLPKVHIDRNALYIPLFIMSIRAILESTFFNSNIFV